MAPNLSDSGQAPLLLSKNPDAGCKGITAGWVFAKWVLDMTMGLVFALWVAIIFLFPAKSVSSFVENWLFKATDTTIFGITGSHFLIFSGPILVIAVLAVARLIISGSGEEELLLKSKSTKYPKFSLWTFPVLVDGPFGVVSAAEFIGICLVFLYVLWAVYIYTLQNLSLLSQFTLPPMLKSSVFLELCGIRLGSIGLYCTGLLFLPVARGSVLLRLIDIPFEQAARYHVWLGHLVMALYTLHGLCYVVAWAMQGRLLEEISAWKDIGIANLPGVISLLAGLLMWVTSFGPVRKKNFELFFYTHQLYIVFVVFFALHVGDFIFAMAAGGIFLFMLDRFLRFWQSRRTVNVISASCLPCGTVELVLSKPANLSYNALSFVFLQIRELSWLQWHPFSVSSSPLDGKNHLSILIKVLGEWTAKLKGNVLDIAEANAQNKFALKPPKITASVEGPYGHELPYHLMYENLILVAGGIGVSPFFAILSDILYRIEEDKLCPPSNVLLIWAIKKSDEIPLLSTLDMESICPFSGKLNLQIDIYITRESEPSLEEGNVIKKEEISRIFPVSSGCGMSVLVGTGNNIWSGLYVISSIIGLITMKGLVNVFYVHRFGITEWWKLGILFFCCMIGGVVVFGGLVVFLWYCWEKRMSAMEKLDERKQNLQTATVTTDDQTELKPASSKRLIYGSRPNFTEIFGSVSEQWGHVNVGVLVCGPATLQTSVAKECRSRNIKRGSNHPIFHFNSHSFDL